MRARPLVLHLLSSCWRCGLACLSMNVDLCARFWRTEQAHEAAQHTTFTYTDAASLSGAATRRRHRQWPITCPAARARAPEGGSGLGYRGAVLASRSCMRAQILTGSRHGLLKTCGESQKHTNCSDVAAPASSGAGASAMASASRKLDSMGQCAGHVSSPD